VNDAKMLDEAKSRRAFSFLRMPEIIEHSEDFDYMLDSNDPNRLKFYNWKGGKDGIAVREAWGF
jgi:hypothetical protein